MTVDSPPLNHVNRFLWSANAELAVKQKQATANQYLHERVRDMLRALTLEVTGAEA